MHVFNLSLVLNATLAYLKIRSGFGMGTPNNETGSPTVQYWALDESFVDRRKLKLYLNTLSKREFSIALSKSFAIKLFLLLLGCCCFTL